MIDRLDAWIHYHRWCVNMTRGYHKRFWYSWPLQALCDYRTGRECRKEWTNG